MSYETPHQCPLLKSCPELVTNQTFRFSCLSIRWVYCKKAKKTAQTYMKNPKQWSEYEKKMPKDWLKGKEIEEKEEVPPKEKRKRRFF